MDCYEREECWDWPRPHVGSSISHQHPKDRWYTKDCLSGDTSGYKIWMIYQWKSCCAGGRLIHFWKEMKGTMMCTPGEPIYPDISSIPEGECGRVETPEWVLHLLSTEIDWDSLKPGEYMFYQIPEEFLQKYPELLQILDIPPDYKDHVLDVKKFEDLEIDFEKPSNPGKPSNNKDPYPVDHKIAQLQRHHPQVKINEVQYCQPSDEYKDLITYIIAMSDWTEKRLVQIENIMSKQMHYIHRMSSRININCVYYGGQKEENKYQCIRCLHDDLISDGQIMTLDQCLNCTRYEPIIGKVYDIIDENAHNVSIMYDDNQKSYRTMEEYFDLIRTERMHENPDQEIGKLDLENVDEKPEDFETFDEIWKDRSDFKMNWCDTSIESQRPHINVWGNDSNQYQEPVFNNIPYSPYDAPTHDLHFDPDSDNIEEAQETFDENKDFSEAGCQEYAQSISSHWVAGVNWGRSNVEGTIRRMKSDGWEDVLIDVCKQNNFDPALVLATIVAESTGNLMANAGNDHPYKSLMQTNESTLPSNWRSMDNKSLAAASIQAGIDNYNGLKYSFRTYGYNLMLLIVCYNTGTGTVLGVSGQGVKPLTQLIPGLSNSNRPSWTWEQVGPCIVKNAVSLWGSSKELEVGQHYPKVLTAYNEIVKRNIFGRNTENNPNYGLPGLHFPFTTQTIRSASIRYTSPYGIRDGKMHRGVDIAGDNGSPIVSIADGTIERNYTSSTAGGHTLVIRHANNLFSVYMHLLERSSIPVNTPVKGGEVVARMGGSGANGAENVFNPHLHLEIHEQTYFDGNDRNPVDYYPSFQRAHQEFIRINGDRTTSGRTAVYLNNFIPMDNLVENTEEEFDDRGRM